MLWMVESSMKKLFKSQLKRLLKSIEEETVPVQSQRSWQLEWCFLILKLIINGVNAIKGNCVS